MSDLLVTNGTVVDGTGSPSRRADLRIRQGRIAEIGEGLRAAGEQVIDAEGAIVAPGFIDVHTHYDPALFWDPFCDPMPQHGVTTVLFGNCSVSLAPVRPRDRDLLTDLFSFVEDVPLATLQNALPWTWETYDDYAALLGSTNYGVNVAALVGHTPIRQWVMGDDAWERPATRDERAELATVLDSCLAAGAFGLSVSMGFDEDRRRRPVPSRLADDDELSALIDVVADRGRFVQYIPDPGNQQMLDDATRMARLCGPRNVLNTWIGIFHDENAPERALATLDMAAELQASGLRTLPQVSPRTLDIQLNWHGGFSFNRLEHTWHKAIHAPADEKAKMLADPTWRAQARNDWDRNPNISIRRVPADRVRLTSVTKPEHERWVGATFGELLAERGGHASDVLADWILDNDLRPGVVVIGTLNSDPDGVADTLTHPAALVGNSDSGAHVQMFCAAGDTTLLLTRHVRDRGDFTLESAIWQITGRPAELFGFRDRGVLRPGAIGDLVVFDLDELRWERDEFVPDLPTGASRLRRPPGGYRYTVVSGVITQQGDTLTGARPGSFLRGEG